MKEYTHKHEQEWEKDETFRSLDLMFEFLLSDINNIKQNKHDLEKNHSVEDETVVNKIKQ